MTADDRPLEMSVVIPAVHSAALLRKTLDSLARQPRPDALEILVVDRLPSAQSDAIAREYPRVRIVPGGGLAIPQMRAEGLSRAAAPIVAVLADHLEAAPSWQDAMRRGHAAGAAAVGGPIAYAGRSTVSWAAFLLEYGEHMPPLATGPATSLPGGNVSYSGEALRACRELYSAGAWETVVHDALARSGLSLVCEGAAEAVLAKTFTVSGFASQRWRLARSYAGMRARSLSPAGRLLAALAAPLKLPFRALRIVRRVRARPGRGYARELARSSLWLVFFLLVWTAGDAAGYLFGEGDSTRRVV